MGSKENNLSRELWDRDSSSNIQTHIELYSFKPYAARSKGGITAPPQGPGFALLYRKFAKKEFQMGRKFYGLLIFALMFSLANGVDAKTYLLPAHVSQLIDSYNRDFGLIASFHYTEQSTSRVHQCLIVKNSQINCRSQPISRGPNCPGSDCPTDIGAAPAQSLVIEFKSGSKFYCSGDLSTTDLPCRSEFELKNCPGPGCPN